MTSIFLSHSHLDKPFVRKLADDLGKFGIRVWVDEAEIRLGDSLIEKIREGIDQMEYLAVILSPNSVNSEWVKKEVDVAMNQEIEGRKVKVLPLLVQDCRVPGFLKGKLYADFRDEEKYEAGLEMILERLGIAVSAIKKKMYLSLVNDAMKLQSKSGYFYGETFLVLMSSVYGFPLVEPFKYTFPEQSSPTIRKGLIEAFENVYNERRKPEAKKLHVCIGREPIYVSFTEADIPFLVNDFPTNTSMFRKMIKSKVKESRESDYPKDKLDDLVSMLVNLALQRSDYRIGVPLYKHSLYEQITWLLDDRINFHIVTLSSLYGPEEEDVVTFWMKEDSVVLVYNARLGIHHHADSLDSLTGVTRIARDFKDSTVGLAEINNKQIEVWLVPKYSSINAKEVKQISQLCENLEKKFAKIDRSMKFVLVNKENLTEMLGNKDLRWFIEHFCQFYEYALGPL